MRDYDSFFLWFRKKTEIFSMKDSYVYIKLLQFRDSNIIQRFIVGFFSVKCREIAIQRFRQHSEISRQVIFDVNVLWKTFRDSGKTYKFVVGSFFMRKWCGNISETRNKLRYRSLRAKIKVKFRNIWCFTIFDTGSKDVWGKRLTNSMFYTRICSWVRYFLATVFGSTQIWFSIWLYIQVLVWDQNKIRKLA